MTDPVRALLYSASCLALVTAPAVAQTTDRTAYAIPAGRMADALRAYATKTGEQILFDADTIGERQAPAIEGSLSAREALDKLLTGSGLEASRPRTGVVVIRPKPRRGAALDIDELSSLEQPTQLDELVVTGSLIRGAGDGPSPVVIFDREAIDRAGHASVAEMLQDLPQNFGGGSTPDTQQVQSDGRNTNLMRSTGVDLRGMGSGATLVLVNGRRMAGTGTKGDFADVSAIPTAAIDRVDILLDGASALYGSDAVGGVVNIALKRDFDGAETRLRVGGARGGAAERMFAQTIGRGDANSHVLLSYEHQHRGALAGSKRPFTRSADLRALGGTDRRNIYAAPGNIVSASLVPLYAIGAAGGPGGPLTFTSGVANLGEPREGFTVLPQQERKSLYLAAGHRITDGLRFDADARWSRRDYEARSSPSVSAITVTSANPGFASPTGASSHVVAYSFARDLGAVRVTGMSESLGASAGLTWDFVGDWRAEGYLAFAREFGRNLTGNQVHSLFLAEALGRVADNPATTYSAARDGYFDPFRPGASSPAAVRHVGSGYGRIKTRSDVATANLQVDGSLVDLPGGPLRAAFGGQLRKESFAYGASSFTSAISPIAVVRPTFERDVLAVFGELRAPLVGSVNARPGIAKLELSAAGRVERYSLAGTTADPKLGVIWEPIERLKIRSSFGTSFRAPTLPEMHEAYVISPAMLTAAGGSSVIGIIQQGGNLDLKPETARTWTVGFEARPINGLSLSATWFETKYENRIGRPASENLLRVLQDPDLASFVTRVSPATVSADRAIVQGFLDSPAYSPTVVLPVDGFGAIIDARYLNTGSLAVKGADLAARYEHRVGANRLSFEANSTILTEYRRSVAPGAAPTDLLDLAGYPLDFRGRLRVAWTRGDTTASASVNHVGAYKAFEGRRVDDWTTIDAQVRWSSGGAKGLVSGLVLALSAQNLLDTDPPFFDAPQFVGYDPANADPTGRYLSLQLTKRW